jgi:hypothetical protein
VAACLCLTGTVSAASSSFYLSGDGVPVASLTPDVPTSSSLPNHDPDRDSAPGLLILRGGAGAAESDPDLHQQWVGPADGVSLDAPLALELWSAMRDFATGRRGVIEAFLLDCDAFGADCSLLATGRRDVLDWSGGWGSWTPTSIELGHVTHDVSVGRSLAVKIVVGADSDDDMWIAYDSRLHPSRLNGEAPSDIRVDGSVDDWMNGWGSELVIDDQGGPNDWGSPAKLDITRFGISSNGVDAFHLLVGFDDVPPQSTTAATLIDMDLDNNVDFAVVATLDGSDSTVELYSCDDTITFGCEGAGLVHAYPASFFAVGQGPGPWDEDSYLEMTLPFNDLAFPGGVVVFTSLFSYASASLLNSPKDAVLGVSEQNYVHGIQHDTTTGGSRLIGAIGSGFVVRRHGDPSQVRSAAAYANPATAPFDDSPGSLTDGESYFYVVEKSGGLQVSLSVHAGRYDDSVRIGFDDHDAISAAADANRSTVTVDTGSVPADGTTPVTVTVIPRDLHGTPIGSGCALGVDATQLAPGVLAGPVRDNRDGSYAFGVVSTDVGDGTAVVSVEGIVLDTRPLIVFD